MSRCRICAQIATVFTWRTACGGFQLGRSTAAGCPQSVEKNMVGERPTGDSASRAKVFKAHAVPQGLCENLINALKLLANQQSNSEYCNRLL